MTDKSTNTKKLITFHSVMEKLKAVPEYPTFIRHINGNTLDNRADNLCYVALIDAFRNIMTWKVDWVCYVDADEVRFMKSIFSQAQLV